MCVRQLRGRPLVCVRLLPRQLHLCLQPNFLLTRAGDVGRRLTAVQSAHSCRICVEGARGRVTLKKYAGSVSLTWHLGGLWTSWAAVMQSALHCPMPGEASVIQQRLVGLR